MNIKQVKDATLVGQIIVCEKEHIYKGDKYIRYKKKLQLQYDPSFDSELKKKKLSIVYIITVNGEMRKIGQTSGKGGIHGCFTFYCIAGFDDPSQRSFGINYLMREEIKRGNKVEVYMKYLDLVSVSAPGLFGHRYKKAAISAKVLEEACLEDYQMIHGANSFPPWNFQEKGSSIFEEVRREYGKYIIKRAQRRIK